MSTAPATPDGSAGDVLKYPSFVQALLPLGAAEMALPNVLLTLSDDALAVSALRLTGLDCTLPSEEEQSRKKESALLRLSDYVQLCGGKLDEGWACAVRCRLTTRRNGCLGVTTDNYYYSPTGHTFRSHEQVTEFLGLSELKKPVNSSGAMVSNDVVRTLQPGLQLVSSSSLSAVSTDSHFSSASNNSMLKRPADLASAPEPQHTAKRLRAEHAAAVMRPKQTAWLEAPSNCTLVSTFDLSFAAQAARSAASHHAALAAQAALMGPLPAPGSLHSAAGAAVKPCNTPSCEQQPQKQLTPEHETGQDVQEPAAVVAQPVSSAMAPPPKPPAKRTKALLASKYKASSNHAAADSTVVAAAPPSGSSSGGATSSPCAAATNSCCSLSRFLCRQDLQQAPVSCQLQSEQQCVQRTQQQGAHSTIALPASSSQYTATSATVVAQSSTVCTASSPAKLKQRQHIMQYRTKELKPVVKQQPPGPYKAKKQPAWRANLRMLASQLAADTAGSGCTAASNMSTAVSPASTATKE